MLATSTDVERVFSKGCLVLSHICNRLTIASMRVLTCLGAWRKLDVVRDSDIKFVAMLPDITEEKELGEGWDDVRSE